MSNRRTKQRHFRQRIEQALRTYLPDCQVLISDASEGSVFLWVADAVFDRFPALGPRNAQIIWGILLRTLPLRRVETRIAGIVTGTPQEWSLLGAP